MILRILALLATLLVCFGLPAALWVALKRKHRDEPIGRAVLLGALGFAVPQLCIRLPLLTWLQSSSAAFNALAYSPLLYGLTLAFSAALFETAGRLAVQKLLLRRSLSPAAAFASGVGHGGIEAVVLVGVNYLVSLGVLIYAQLGGTISSVFAPFFSVSPALYLLAGYERLMTILFHVFLSWLLGRMILRGRTWLGVLLCLLLHTAMDFSVSLFSGYLAIYSAMTVITLGCAAAFLLLRRRDRLSEQAIAQASDTGEESV